MSEHTENITFKDGVTIGEMYGPAMKIQDPDEAENYFKALVAWQMKTTGVSQEEAERREKLNLGYYAGYYDTETRLRVEKLFQCAHPIFGSAANGVPTAKEAFEMGKAVGVAIKKNPAQPPELASRKAAV